MKNLNVSFIFKRVLVISIMGSLLTVSSHGELIKRVDSAGKAKSASLLDCVSNQKKSEVVEGKHVDSNYKCRYDSSHRLVKNVIQIDKKTVELKLLSPSSISKNAVSYDKHNASNITKVKIRFLNADDAKQMVSDFKNGEFMKVAIDQNEASTAEGSVIPSKFVTVFKAHTVNQKIKYVAVPADLLSEQKSKEIRTQMRKVGADRIKNAAAQ